ASGTRGAYKEEKFARRFTLQANAPVRAWCGMDNPMMKAVRRRKLPPISHRVSTVTPRSTAGRWNNPAALHAETIRSGALMLLFRVNVKISLRCRLRGHTNRNGRRHKTTVALHDINVFLRQRNQHSHLGWVVRFIRGDVIRPARAHMASRSAAAEQQCRRAGAQQN